MPEGKWYKNICIPLCHVIVDWSISSLTNNLTSSGVKLVGSNLSIPIFFTKIKKNYRLFWHKTYVSLHNLYHLGKQSVGNWKNVYISSNVLNKNKKKFKVIFGTKHVLPPSSLFGNAIYRQLKKCLYQTDTTKHWFEMLETYYSQWPITPFTLVLGTC